MEFCARDSILPKLAGAKGSAASSLIVPFHLSTTVFTSDSFVARARFHACFLSRGDKKKNKKNKTISSRELVSRLSLSICSEYFLDEARGETWVVDSLSGTKYDCRS